MQPPLSAATEVWAEQSYHRDRQRVLRCRRYARPSAARTTTFRHERRDAARTWDRNSGAITGAVGLAAVYGVNPDVAFDMDRDLPRLVSGFYPAERSGTTTFAWASRSATLSLPGVDRRAPWTCAVHFRGGRVDDTTQPMVELTIDGIPLASRLATNSYEVVEATAPPARSPGLVLAITSSTTFVPGPADRRELAIQVDFFVCRPAKGEIVLPPRRAITAAAIGGAVFGLAFGLSGLSFGAAAAEVLVLALVQALPLAAGTAPFMRAAPPAAALSCWIALTTLLVARVLEWRNGEPLRRAARFVLMFTAAALYIKLLGLLHPSKLPVDVVFQAHRLEWVLNGRFFFTQPLPSGVQFPYAIALYVFAAPWSLVTRDYVSLLRIVVCACEAAAGGLLYVMIARTWHDRGAGAVAVVLFSLVPISYGCTWQREPHERVRPIRRSDRPRGSNNLVAAGSRDPPDRWPRAAHSNRVAVARQYPSRNSRPHSWLWPDSSGCSRRPRCAGPRARFFWRRSSRRFCPSSSTTATSARCIRISDARVHQQPQPKQRRAAKEQLPRRWAPRRCRARSSGECLPRPIGR